MKYQKWQLNPEFLCKLTPINDVTRIDRLLRLHYNYGLWNNDCSFLGFKYCLLIGGISKDKVGQNNNSVLFALLHRCERIGVHKSIRWVIFIIAYHCTVIDFTINVCHCWFIFINYIRINLKIVSTCDEFSHYW